MAGPEPGDLFIAPRQTPSFLECAEREPGRLRIGLLTKSDKWIDPEVVAAARQAGVLLTSLGHDVEEADVDLTGLGKVFRTVVEAGNAAIEVDTPERFSDPYTRWCYERGSRTSAADYISAMEAMHRRGREIILQSSEWDCLLTPTVTLTPQPLDTFLADTERVADDDLAYIPFTYPFNISGQPAISLPLGWSRRRASDRRANRRSAVRRSPDHQPRGTNRAGGAMGSALSGGDARLADELLSRA